MSAVTGLKSNLINLSNKRPLSGTKESLKFIDFCAGIGAGRIGLEKNGLTCVGFSEIDKQAELTYRKLFGDEEINYGDLMKIDANKLPDFDMMIAGFPCQSFSVIGQRKGMQDERGQIIYGLTKIMRSKNLKYFILENVKGLTNHEKGNSLKIILNELDRVGYKVFHKVLNSIDYGVPQMRERIYLVGIRKDLVPKNFEFNFPEPQSKVDVKHYLIDPRESEFKENKVVYATFLRYLKNKYNNNQYSVKSFLKQEYVILDTRQSDLRIYHNRVPTLRTGRHGILYVRDGKFRKLSGVESLLLQGFPKDLIKRVDGYINENYLLKQAGNAMTVNTIEAISRELFKTLKKYEQ